MSFEVKTTPHFEREAKILAKRYKSFKADMKDFIESLEKNPMQGDELSPGIRKIRLAIVSKGKGKSGGARVITYTICASESEGRVYLVDVYDKSDFSTVSVSILKKSYLNRVSFDQSALVKRTVFFLFSVCKGNSTLRSRQGLRKFGAEKPHSFTVRFFPLEPLTALRVPLWKWQGKRKKVCGYAVC